MNVTSKEFIEMLQSRIALTSIGPSTLRNQGSRKVVDKARKYLDAISISDFLQGSGADFQAALDHHTKVLKNKLPAGARHWGTARKAINVFLRDVLYNRYLCKYYKFHKVERWLEVPLDSYVVRGLKEHYLRKLPRWKGIIHLTKEDSLEYQKAAYLIAKTTGLARVHLDLFWWRKGKKTKLQST